MKVSNEENGKHNHNHDDNDEEKTLITFVYRKASKDVLTSIASKHSSRKQSFEIEKKNVRILKKPFLVDSFKRELFQIKQSKKHIELFYTFHRFVL